MTVSRVVIAGLFLSALAAGTASDRAPAPVVRVVGEYQVLAGDFHVHSFPFTWSTLSPVDTVIEARHQGLDAVAMTPHNQVWAAKAGRLFSRAIGGPMILVGEEMTTARYHLIAVGIAHAIVGRRDDVSSTIDEVHRQGGVAIAAHPYPSQWSAYDAQAIRKLDGSEVVRPDAQSDETLAADLRAFFGRARLTAIGSSDYHGFGALGSSRTYVFVRNRTDEDVLDALRHGRTVVYDRDRVYGDPALIRLVSERGGLPHTPPAWPAPGFAKLFSRSAALAAIIAFFLSNGWRPRAGSARAL